MELMRNLEESYRNLEDSKIQIKTENGDIQRIPNLAVLIVYLETVKDVLIELNERIEKLENK